MEDFHQMKDKLHQLGGRAREYMTDAAFNLNFDPSMFLIQRHLSQTQMHSTQAIGGGVR